MITNYFGIGHKYVKYFSNNGKVAFLWMKNEVVFIPYLWGLGPLPRGKPSGASQSYCTGSDKIPQPKIDTYYFPLG